MAERVTRRLAAILAADVVGYSRLMGVDEAGTLAPLKALRKDLFEHGTFIYLIGPDGKFLTLFPPVMAPDAMAAAIGRYLG